MGKKVERNYYNLKALRMNGTMIRQDIKDQGECNMDLQHKTFKRYFPVK